MKRVYKFLVKKAAKGIPSKEDYGDLSKLEKIVGQLSNYLIHKHDAQRAGQHFDLRLEGPEGLYSWAVRKGLPEEAGKSHLAIRQPLHTKEYGEFEGKIEEGYGKGEVEISQKGKILFDDIQYDENGEVKRIKFSLDSTGTPERFVLSNNDKDNRWLLINVTPNVTPSELGYEKPHYKVVDEVDDLINKVSKDQPMTVKVDGALNLLRVLKNRAEVLSYRTSTEGKPIYHTERLAPQLAREQDIPKDLQNTVFSGEVYGVQDGKTLEVNELAGLLNSSLAKARNKINKQNIDMKMSLIDVITKDKKLSAEDKKDLIAKAMSTFPEFITEFPKAETPEEAKKLLNQVISGQHPLSEEGVVFDTDTGKKLKHKGWKEWDVIVSDILPGQGKYSDGYAGAIEYKLRPQGPIVGRVGTGLTDQKRKQLWENRDKYKGQVARVKALKQFPETGALRAPVFIGMHTDYPTQREGRTYYGPEIENRLNKEAYDGNKFYGYKYQLCRK